MARVGLPAALGQAVSAKRGVLETENSLGYEGGAPLFGEKVKSEVTSFSGGLMCKMPSSINVFKDAYLNAIRDVIFKNRLSNFLDEFPWLTGHLGNPFAPVWFIGENPSRSRVEHIDKVSTSHSENLQWSYKFREARLFRDALTKAGLKEGDPAEDIGWNCYITNVTKEPEVVKKRNNEKGIISGFYKKESAIWLDVLQYQIDFGSPRVLVELGSEAARLLDVMKKCGLRTPPIEKIPHYSYVMLRPDSKTKLGPGHPERQAEFSNKIRTIAEKFGTGLVEHVPS